jgi:hypothetical protein
MCLDISEFFYSSRATSSRRLSTASPQDQVIPLKDLRPLQIHRHGPIRILQLVEFSCRHLFVRHSDVKYNMTLR